MYVSHAVSTRKEKLQDAVKDEMLIKQKDQKKEKKQCPEKESLIKDVQRSVKEKKKTVRKRTMKIVDLLLAAREITQKHLHLYQDT